MTQHSDTPGLSIVPVAAIYRLRLREEISKEVSDRVCYTTFHDWHRSVYLGIALPSVSSLIRQTLCRYSAASNA
jgi:hypothetical protein